MTLTIPIALVFALGGVQAEHCTTWTTSTTDLDEGMIIIPIRAPQTTLYFFVDLCQPECLFSNWFYEESNGIEGLQRADDIAVDTCHGMIEPDTYVF